MMLKNEDKIWYVDNFGRLHRENGPAVIHSNNSLEWHLNGKLHRTDGPAIEYTNGHREWHIHGNKHRDDGPAVIWPHGEKDWYLNNRMYTYENWFRALTPEQRYNYLWNLDE